ncbi:MAG: hypothetical protein QW567_00520 [Candidatus Hadarchaeales archaeon]
MGKVAGACSLCGRVGTEVYRCGICGAVACAECFLKDIKACKKCVRKGLWVESSKRE